MPEASNFAFVRAGWPGPVADAAEQAEHYARRDPRTACFYARRALELAVRDALGIQPWNRHHERRPLGQLLADEQIQHDLGSTWEPAKRHLLHQGNAAVHQEQDVSESAAAHTVKVLHRVLAELARQRGETVQKFDSELITGHLLSNPASAEQVRTLERALDDKDRDIERLQHALEEAPSAEEAKELERRLTRTRSAYDRLLATRAMTSSRFLHGLGSMPFEGLLHTIREGSERPDEQDEAAAVVLETLAQRHASLFGISLPDGI